METSKIYYGWYSANQKEMLKECKKLYKPKGHYKIQFSSFIYLNSDGKEVEVTEVVSNPEFISNFKDAKRVGKVTKFIRGIP
tara:strand:- start:454 stop:699 length:246 start_codon:yes stop_codon:yes gene_type:complete